MRGLSASFGGGSATGSPTKLREGSSSPGKLGDGGWKFNRDLYDSIEGKEITQGEWLASDAQTVGAVKEESLALSNDGTFIYATKRPGIGGAGSWFAHRGTYRLLAPPLLRPATLAPFVSFKWRG